MIRIATREIEVVWIIPSANGEWKKQIARNLIDCETGYLLGHKYLIQDQGTSSSEDFFRKAA
jgi:hypothetical protein